MHRKRASGVPAPDDVGEPSCFSKNTQFGSIMFRRDVSLVSDFSRGPAVVCVYSPSKPVWCFTAYLAGVACTICPRSRAAGRRHGKRDSSCVRSRVRLVSDDSESVTLRESQRHSQASPLRRC